MFSDVERAEGKISADDLREIIVIIKRVRRNGKEDLDFRRRLKRR